ncbi:MAG: DnaA/Hda family protein [Desulfovermiculus sp.]|nr:DnaA/Hda family protein [Desulfovermiculus sp.]
MTDWNQRTLRQIIQAHFQPSHTQANPSWVNSVCFEAQSDGTLMIQFPHTYFQDWFRQYLQKDFEAFILDHVPGISGFVYHNQTHQHQPKERLFQPFQGDDGHTFQGFLYNDKNRDQVLTAKALLNQSRWPTTPLLICGPRGCGKTHLLLAMANSLLDEDTSGIVLALTCDDLFSISSLRAEDKERARNELCMAQALLVDDVQRIEKSRTLQDELLLVYDVLEETGMPMVFTCLHKIPEDGEMIPKLRSRLEGGIIVHLKSPDLDIRGRFVQQESEHRGLNLSEGEQLALARQCTDFQSITQVLLRLVAQHDLRSSTHRPDISQLIDQAGTGKPQPLSCEEIMSQVATHFSLTVEELTSHRRQQKIVLARQVAIFICRFLHNASFTHIGSLFGGRNHSSIIYAFKRIQSLQKDRPELKSQVQTLLKQCAEKSKESLL